MAKQDVTQESDLYFVYWLRDELCVDIAQHGYVGVTRKLDLRLRQHRYRFLFPYDSTVIFTGTKMECLRKEEELRPLSDMGWNVAAGGPGHVRPHSEQTRAKIRLAKTGRKLSEAHRAKYFGKKHSLETRMKMSASHKARGSCPKNTPATRAKIAAAARGRKASEESRAKMRAAYARNGHPLKGKPHTLETRETIRLANIGNRNAAGKRTPEQCARIGAAGVGRKVSDETRAKLSAAGKLRKARVLSDERREV